MARRFISDVPLAPGDAGTAQTIKQMRQMVDKARGNLEVRDAALGIVRRAGVTPKDTRGEIAALFSWVRDQVHYLRDPVGIELVHAPHHTLRQRAGDCDDKVTLLAGLLESIGYSTQFVTVATKPGDFHHVIVEVRSGRRWVPLDPTVEKATPGWEHPGLVRRKRWGESVSPIDLSGYDFRQVNKISETASRLWVEAGARGQLARDIADGLISSTDVRLAKNYIDRDGRFFLPPWQRRMMTKLADEALTVLKARPGLDAARVGVAGIEGVENLGSIFGSIWNGIKGAAKAVVKVATTPVVAAAQIVTGHPGDAWKTIKSGVGTVAKIAQVVGPALVVIPGIGTVAAAAITTAGEIIAPGQPVPPGAIPVNEIPVGAEVEVNAATATTSAVTSQTATKVVTAANAAGRLTKVAEPQYAGISVGGSLSDVPWYVWAGGGALLLLVLATK